MEIILGHSVCSQPCMSYLNKYICHDMYYFG